MTPSLNSREYSGTRGPLREVGIAMVDIRGESGLHGGEPFQLNSQVGMK
jgi:hypothetical protein